MNIFGGNPAIVNPRTRGDTSTLPMQLQITTSRLSAISKLAIGLFLAVLGYDNIGSFSNWVFRSSSFSFFVLGPCTLPGHASLRSLVDAGMASLHACVGLAVESLALRRASSGAAAFFGFIHKPRPVRTIRSGSVGWLFDHATPATFS